MGTWSATNIMAEVTTPALNEDSGWIPKIGPGNYPDGKPLDRIRYLQCKLSLKPDLLTSREALFELGEVVTRPAKKNGMTFRHGSFTRQPHGIREVQFLDTEDFRLYNNHFILRRRVRYLDGFPTGHPEIVFKYRHPDARKAAEMDVRPIIPGRYQIKFKAQALPSPDVEEGIRLLYSHNVQFTRADLPEDGDRSAFDTLADILPPLHTLKETPGEHISLVNGTIVEEVDQNVGVLDFGSGRTSVVNLALWRTRGEHTPLIGELSFQIKLRRREEVTDLNLERGRSFFRHLQREAGDWLRTGVTKTGIVYHLKGNPPNAHE